MKMYLYVNALDKQAWAEGKSTVAVHSEKDFDLLKTLSKNSLNIRRKADENKCGEQMLSRIHPYLGFWHRLCCVKLKIAIALQQNNRNTTDKNDHT